MPRTRQWKAGKSKMADSATSGNNNARLMRELNGHKLLPPETPPVFVGQPWNSITVILRITADGSDQKITVEDLRVALRAQTGFNNVPDTVTTTQLLHFDFRVKNILAWATDGHSMCMMPMDIIADTTELVRIDSNAQRNMYARAGYKLPLAQSSMTISTARSPKKVICILLGANSYEVHLNLLWKGADTALPKSSFTYPPSKLRAHKIRELELELERLHLMEDDFSQLGSIPDSNV